MTRNERLYAITEYLRRRRTACTVEDLVRHFGVGERTIFRDLASLREQGVPIVGDPGRGGGLRLESTYSMPPLALSVDEAIHLWISLRLGSLVAPTPVGETLGGALDKIVGSLPAPKRGALEAILRRVVVGRPVPPERAAGAGPIDPGIFRICESAFVASQRLEIHYVDRHGAESQRVIEPHGLLVQLPLWYLIAWDPAKEGSRAFRLDRIRSVTQRTGTAFSPRDPRVLVREIEQHRVEVPEPAPWRKPLR